MLKNLSSIDVTLKNQLGDLINTNKKKISTKTVTKFVWLVSWVSINFFTSPVTAEEIDRENRVETAANIVCLSASGNGYNWASTLTWAAEIIKDAVNKAASENTRFNVACVSGASSGSPFTATYGSLLQNKQLFDRGDFNPQSITKQEAEILSDALLYMALAADFSPTVMRFYTVFDGESRPNPPWWKSQYSLERIMLDFGTRVMLAQHISQADIKEVARLDTFVRYKTMEELASAVRDTKLRRQYRRVTFDIWQQSQTIIDRLYENATYKRANREEDRDDFRDNPDHPVRKALAQKPADGILALTYAELAFTESTLDYRKMRSQPPSIDTLVPFVFTNEATAKKIIQSPFYQSRVAENDPYVGQYVICVVPDYYTMILHGVREPEAMPPGTYRLAPMLENDPTDLAAGVSYFYQPLAEQNWYSRPRFKLIPSTRFLRSQDKLLNARMGVAGGWIDSFVGGEATLYLGSGYAADRSDSDLYFSTYSRLDGMSNFALKVVKKYFAPKNAEEAIAKIERHRDYLPVLIEHYRAYFADSTISWQPIFVDFAVRYFPENQGLFARIVGAIDNILNLGLNAPPAAITRQSNYLLARTTNRVRQTLGTHKDLGYIYDRSYEPQYYQKEELTN